MTKEELMEKITNTMKQVMAYDKSEEAEEEYDAGFLSACGLIFEWVKDLK